ncbi:BlaI/MecI/CopY family transcriptional regulator [Streptomyces beihaiensis]|uniref:BlaI/MecI/CopY family transcriptional regulator n=1 Tax=Streptomyces beihaiensis TaxID=2984495 RepID=A0ABT3TVT1_9ACTN|nr:BlaI/MecI/CopY family transcriptional regulator [Streptomyces beihaiensis]MCX3061143.1 BlaI/MecI/CopY family transcriptional regulator [Streptomyces beihaiensis]
MDSNAPDRAGKRANGERETQVLDLLLHADEALTPGEVAERIGGELTYSSVVTILTRMHTKGLLTRSRRGRAYAYAPVTDAPGFAARRMNTVLQERPDREAVLARFADNLSDTDADLLRQLLGPDSDSAPGHRATGA